MSKRVKRARRSQLSVPGSSEKMLQKAAASAAKSQSHVRR
jgi:hypothetical protein